MSEPVEYLDLDDLIELASGLLGDPPPIRDVGLLGSAAARPQTSAFGEDAYPDIWTKAAALLQSILENHALVDGNKRPLMAMTLRLTDDEQAALRERAEREGISMQDAARRAVRDYVAKGEHRDRVAGAAERVKAAHGEALERLGE